MMSAPFPYFIKSIEFRSLICYNYYEFLCSYEIIIPDGARFILKLSKLYCGVYSPVGGKG